MRREPLTRLAARQHALFTLHQALAVGLTARQVEHGVLTARWDRLYRGVYRIAGAPATDVQALLAAVLAAGPGAMASHRGAGWLWGLGDLHLDVSGRLQRSPGPGVVVHRRPAGDLRAVRRNGVPCTGALRTVVDLAALDDAALVEQALDRGVAVGLFTVAGMEAELARRSRRGRPGVVLLRRCLAARLDQRGGGPTSMLESAMDRLLRRHCLPLPERQYRLPGTPYRLDYAWPAARLVVEVDGYASHSGLDAFRADRARQNALVLAGWTVLRFTWADVHRRPRWVAGQIRLALAAQTA